MPDTVAQAIVRRALELKRRHPGTSALPILDMAMEGYCGSDPDFSAPGSGPGQETEARQFGELLREAFAPPSVLSRLSAVAAAPQEQWQIDVLQKFASRYGLRLGGRR